MEEVVRNFCWRGVYFSGSEGSWAVPALQSGKGMVQKRKRWKA